MKRTNEYHLPRFALRAACGALAIALAAPVAVREASAQTFEAYGANLLPARKRDKDYETDRWEAFAQLSGVDLEAYLRGVDTGGATASILPTAGAFAGDVEEWAAGECSPLGTNAEPGPTIRCTNKFGSQLILRRATRAGGAQYLRITVRARHQLLVLPMPTPGEVPLVVRVIAPTADVTDDVGACNFPSSGRVICREPTPRS